MTDSLFSTGPLSTKHLLVGLFFQNDSIPPDHFGFLVNGVEGIQLTGSPSFLFYDELNASSVKHGMKRIFEHKFATISHFSVEVAPRLRNLRPEVLMGLSPGTAHVFVLVANVIARHGHDL